MTKQDLELIAHHFKQVWEAIQASECPCQNPGDFHHAYIRGGEAAVRELARRIGTSQSIDEHAENAKAFMKQCGF